MQRHLPHRTRRRASALAATLALVLGATACGSDDASVHRTDHSPSASSPSPNGTWHYDHIGTSRNATILAVTAITSADAWAVGHELGGSQQGFILRYNGHRWSDAPAPSGLDRMPMRGALLRSSGADNLWLFAGTEARRFDGTGWRDVPAPYPHPTPEGVASMRGAVAGAAVLGPDDVWAVGGGTSARHWNGHTWLDVRLPIEAVTLATGPSGRLWAFGSHRTGKHRTQPAALRWDGRSWRPLPMPETHHTWRHMLSENVAVQHAVVRAPDDIWVQQRYDASRLGSDGEETPETGTAMLHWDGRTWSRVAGIRCCGGPFAVDAHNGAVLNGKFRLTEDGRLHRLRRPAAVPGLSAKVTRRDRDQKLEIEDMAPIPGTRQILAVGRIASAPHIQYFFDRPVIARYTSAPG